MSSDSFNHSVERWKRKHCPWLFEIRAKADPLDINYRERIEEDQEVIDQLLWNKSKHFTERCLMYRYQDFELEGHILGGYREWALRMASLPTRM